MWLLILHQYQYFLRSRACIHWNWSLKVPCYNPTTSQSSFTFNFVSIHHQWHNFYVSHYLRKLSAMCRMLYVPDKLPQNWENFDLLGIKLCYGHSFQYLDIKPVHLTKGVVFSHVNGYNVVFLFHTCSNHPLLPTYKQNRFSIVGETSVKWFYMSLWKIILVTPVKHIPKSPPPFKQVYRY